MFNFIYLLWPFGAVPERATLAYSIYFNLSPVAFLILCVVGIMCGFILDKFFPTLTLTAFERGLSIFIYNSVLSLLIYILSSSQFPFWQTMNQKLFGEIPCFALSLGVYLGVKFYRSNHPEIDYAIKNLDKFINASDFYDDLHNPQRRKTDDNS